MSRVLDEVGGLSRLLIQVAIAIEALTPRSGTSGGTLAPLLFIGSGLGAVLTQGFNASLPADQRTNEGGETLNIKN